MQVISDQSRVRKKLKPQDLMVVKVDGQGKKYLEISLTMGKKAIADYEDYSLLIKRKWYVMKHHTGTFYARAKFNNKQVRMHNYLMGTIYIDHINGDPLDNRRCNLRKYHGNQNSWNSAKRNQTSSSFKGVTYNKRLGKWMARVGFNGKRFYLGVFKNEKDARDAYMSKAEQLHGEFFKGNSNWKGRLKNAKSKKINEKNS